MMSVTAFQSTRRRCHPGAACDAARSTHGRAATPCLAVLRAAGEALPAAAALDPRGARRTVPMFAAWQLAASPHAPQPRAPPATPARSTPRECPHLRPTCPEHSLGVPPPPFEGGAGTPQKCPRLPRTCLGHSPEVPSPPPDLPRALPGSAPASAGPASGTPWECSCHLPEVAPAVPESAPRPRRAGSPDGTALTPAKPRVIRPVSPAPERREAARRGGRAGGPILPKPPRDRSSPAAAPDDPEEDRQQRAPLRDLRVLARPREAQRRPRGGRRGRPLRADEGPAVADGEAPESLARRGRGLRGDRGEHRGEELGALGRSRPPPACTRRRGGTAAAPAPRARSRARARRRRPPSSPGPVPPGPMLPDEATKRSPLGAKASARGCVTRAKRRMQNPSGTVTDAGSGARSGRAQKVPSGLPS